MTAHPLFPVLLGLAALASGAAYAWSWARQRRRRLEATLAAARRRAVEAPTLPAPEPEAPSVERAPPTPGGAPLPGWLRGVVQAALSRRYQRFRLLDSGASGARLEAWDLQLERPVMVKVPPPHLSAAPEFPLRFRREGRVLARFDHPGMVRVYEVPEVGEQETPVMVLERTEGETLRAAFEAGGRAMDPAGVAALVEALAEVLDHLHAGGVCHRNLGLDSIWVGPEGRPRLTDFGLVAVRDASRWSRCETGAGAEEYLPPEVLAGEDAAEGADRYALAALAAHLLRGTPPFAQDDLRREARVEVPAFEGPMRARVEGALGQALAPDPGRRPDSCGAFAAALRSAVSAG